MTEPHPFILCAELHFFEREEHCAFIDPISQETCGEGPDAEIHAGVKAA